MALRNAGLQGRAWLTQIGRVTASSLLFLGLSALVIVTPGPDTAVTINGTLGGGRRGGVFTALGVSYGQAVAATDDAAPLFS